MTAIDLPFAASATRRAPTADELENGYGCGDADLDLFNWMAWWPTGQIARAIAKSGLVVDDTDIERLAKAIRSQAMNYVATVGGTANALTIGLDPAPAAWSDLVGVPLRLVIANANTGAATLEETNIGSTKALVDKLGYPLVGGELRTGMIVTGIYNGTHVRLTEGVEARPSTFRMAVSAMSILHNVESGITGFVVQENRLRGSTLTGSSLQIGGDDAGVWALSWSGATTGFITTAEFADIFVNGVGTGRQASSTGNAANESDLMDKGKALIRRLTVGDLVSPTYYQNNSSGSTNSFDGSFSGVRIGA